MSIAVTSGSLGWRALDGVQVRAPLALYQLADNPQLNALDLVNVRLRDQYENSIAVLVVPSDKVVLVGDAYSEPSAPVGDDFLLTPETVIEWGAEAASSVGDGYVLATIDMTVPAEERVQFDVDHPESERLLYGYWHAPEPDGVWTQRRFNRIVFDVPRELHGRDVEVALFGTRLADADHHREVIVHLDDNDGDVVAEETFERTAARFIRMTIPAPYVTANEGRVVLYLDTPRAVVANELGYADDRVLGFHLQWLSVAQAGSGD